MELPRKSMDYALPPPSQRRRLVWITGAFLTCLAFVVYGAYRLTSAPRSVALERATFSFGTVSEGPFQVGNSFSATIEPRRKLVLATGVGGTIKNLPALAGSRLEDGAIVVELSNPQIEMELLARESEVTQQVANLNSQQIQNQQHSFDYARQVSQARVDLANAESLALRNEALFADGMVSIAVVERSRRDLELARSQVVLLTKSAATFRTLSAQGLAEQRASVDQLRRGLKLSRSVGEQLQVRSPIAGVLINLSVERGQYLAPGAVIGTVGDDREVKLSARLDEFYLDKIKPGQRGAALSNSGSTAVEVERVVGAVTDRKFIVELKPLQPFQKATLGQNVPVTIALSQPRTALKLPVGPFLNDGNLEWVFVLSPDGENASRRKVRFGERNDREIVVLSGLSANEKVLLSSYRDLMNYDRIEFN